MNNLVQCGDVNFSGGPRTGRASRHAAEGLSAAASWSSNGTGAFRWTLMLISDHLYKRRTCACLHMRAPTPKGNPRLRGKNQQSGDGRAATTNTKASPQVKTQSFVLNRCIIDRHRSIMDGRLLRGIAGPTPQRRVA